MFRVTCVHCAAYVECVKSAVKLQKQDYTRECIYLRSLLIIFLLYLTSKLLWLKYLYIFYVGTCRINLSLLQYIFVLLLHKKNFSFTTDSKDFSS